MSSVPVPTPTSPPSAVPPVHVSVATLSSMSTAEFVRAVICLAKSGFRVFVTRDLYESIRDTLMMLGIRASEPARLPEKNYVVMSYGARKLTVQVTVVTDDGKVTRTIPYPVFVSSLKEILSTLSNAAKSLGETREEGAGSKREESKTTKDREVEELVEIIAEQEKKHGEDAREEKTETSTKTKRRGRKKK